MRAYFTIKRSSLYFESNAFNKILEYLKHNFNSCEMKEKSGKLSLIIKDINSAAKAIDICKEILQ